MWHITKFLEIQNLNFKYFLKFFAFHSCITYPYYTLIQYIFSGKFISRLWNIYFLRMTQNIFLSIIHFLYTKCIMKHRHKILHYRHIKYEKSLLEIFGVMNLNTSQYFRVLEMFPCLKRWNFGNNLQGEVVLIPS